MSNWPKSSCEFFVQGATSVSLVLQQLISRTQLSSAQGFAQYTKRQTLKTGEAWTHLGLICLAPYFPFHTPHNANIIFNPTILENQHMCACAEGQYSAPGPFCLRLGIIILGSTATGFAVWLCEEPKYLDLTLPYWIFVKETSRWGYLYLASEPSVIMASFWSLGESMKWLLECNK